MATYLTGRRQINWAAVNGPRAAASLLLATAGGAGLLPWAPGTFGSLVGIPIAFFTRGWPVPARVALWLGLLAVGTWAAGVLDQVMGTTDNQNIVIDEVVGVGITAWTVSSAAWPGWLAAFLLFRLFDVWKPFPIRRVDRWSKHAEGRIALLSGFGVMADDLLAGVYGLIAMVLLRQYGVLH